MTNFDIWLVVLCVFGLLVALGATSGVVNEQLWVSEPLACALAGIAIGPVGAGLLHLDPAANPMDAAILREAARITLAIAVTGAAMRLPAYWLRRNWRGLGVSLVPGMLLMWGAGSAVAAATLGLPLLPSLLLGAAIAPTDPVLSAPILTGRLAKRAVPEDLRDAMTAESGINDGLGLPFVMLSILLMQHTPVEAGLDWAWRVLAWELGGAVLVGAAAGWLTAKCMDWARGRPDAEGTSLLTVTISLALATTAGVRLLGGDDILAAFVAGAVLNNSHREAKVEEHHERFSEALGRFFDLPVMILFGTAIPWGTWLRLGWWGLAFAVGILLLRRMPAWFVLGVDALDALGPQRRVCRLVWTDRGGGLVLRHNDPGRDRLGGTLAGDQPRDRRLRPGTWRHQHPADPAVRPRAAGMPHRRSRRRRAQWHAALRQ